MGGNTAAKPSIKLYFDILSPYTYLIYYIFYVCIKTQKLLVTKTLRPSSTLGLRTLKNDAPFHKSSLGV